MDHFRITNRTGLLLFSDEVIQQIGQVKTPLSEYVTKYAEKGYRFGMN
jgi:hypothetical protein